jgi:hypothetical protein
MCSTTASAAKPASEQSSIEALINEVFETAAVAAPAPSAPSSAPAAEAGPSVGRSVGPPAAAGVAAPVTAAVTATPQARPAPAEVPARTYVAASAPARFAAPLGATDVPRFAMPAPAVGPIDDILLAEPALAGAAVAVDGEPVPPLPTGFYDPEDYAIPREPDLFVGGGGHRRRRFF